MIVVASIDVAIAAMVMMVMVVVVVVMVVPMPTPMAVLVRVRKTMKQSTNWSRGLEILGKFVELPCCVVCLDRCEVNVLVEGAGEDTRHETHGHEHEAPGLQRDEEAHAASDEAFFGVVEEMGQVGQILGVSLRN